MAGQQGCAGVSLAFIDSAQKPIGQRTNVARISVAVPILVMAFTSSTLHLQVSTPMANRGISRLFGKATAQFIRIIPLQSRDR